MHINNINLRNYYHNGYGNIDGWVSEKLFLIFDYIDSLPINKVGGVCEIGVHHGKFYLLMNQLVANSEQSYAIDIFDLQHLNVTHSGGYGTPVNNFTLDVTNIFKLNLFRYDAHNGTNTNIIKHDSTGPHHYLDNIIKPGSLRFFSVDGGHSVEHVINDLNIANRLISNEGLVILDDVCNHSWISVMEGLCKYMMTYPTLVPIAIGFNKMWMCKLSYRDYYYEQFLKSPFCDRPTRFFGNDIISMPLSESAYLG